MPLSQEDIQGKYLQVITRSCLDRFNTYYASEQVYQALKNRCTLIDDAIDLRFRDNQAFIAEVAPPVVRKDYYETNAFLTKYYENDPLVAIKNIGSTPKENAENVQILLASNWLNTRFRQECLLWAFDNLARYGTAVIFSQYHDNYRGAGLQTVYQPDGPTPYPRVPMTGKRAVCNYSVHPLNYFRDPFGNSIGRSYFEGFIDQWYVSDLFQYLNNPLYIQENLQKVIHDCKKGQTEQFWYGGTSTDEKSVRDFTRATINPVRMYTLLNFDGNESDPTIYYIEIINERLVRCHDMDVDGGILPLQTGVYIPRPDVWWGNSSIDMKIPFQNIKNWLINAQIEGTMKQMDRMVLVRRGGGLNVADINQRHQYGGVVFFEGQEDPSKLMYPVQFQNSSLKDLDWLNREVNQMIQESSPVVNMQNKYNEGGMNNNTLGAAQMIAGIGEILFNYTMRNVGYLIERVAEVDIALMLQNMGDTIKLRPSELTDEIELEKRELLGEFVCRAESSMLVNEKSERLDKANVLNMILNWKGTQNPAFAGLKEQEFVKDWVRAWVGQYADITRYYDEKAQPQPVPGPTAPMPGGLPPNIPGPAPAPGPQPMAVAA